MNIIIAGEGKTLVYLSRTFQAKGYKVVIINPHRAECLHLSQHFKGLIIEGDASNPEVLSEAGVLGADVVLAVTPHDADNLIIYQLAKLQFGVPHTLALANDPDNAEVFEHLGVSAFSATQIVANLIEQRAAVGQITNILPVGKGMVNITEIQLSEDAPVAGTYLKDLALPENALVAVLIRDNHAIVPRGASQILGGDRVVLITLPESHAKVIRCFTGEGN